MCGIAGIVSFDTGYRPSREELAGMSARIAHRGPDGEGTLHVVSVSGPTAALAHRRLAILDPDPRSNQPFSVEYAGRRAHLVYNGEIYNFRDVRRRLETVLPGFAWRTTGDTEVLAAAYLAWGDRCVDMLLGMFAFAVFDETAGTLLLGRDRMGQKPLYVAEANGRIGFASELGAVASLLWVDGTTDEGALSDYLAFGYVPTPRSIYVGVKKLPPATVRMYSTNSELAGNASPVAVSTSTYFSPADVRPPILHEPEIAVREAVEAAVTSQLVSDVPLGCFLSGGIDSSITALCAHRALQRAGHGPLQTFTARFDDPRYDESPFAAEVAAALGTEHHTFTVQPDAANDLPLLAESYGEPFGDSSALPSYYLSRETRRHVKVALSGDGGDELFGGYDRYRALLMAERLSPVRRWLPDVSPSGHPKSRRTRIARFLQGARLPAAERYEGFMRLFPPGVLGAPALSGSIAGQPFVRPWGREAAGVVDAAMALDRATYLPDDLLAKLDRASMRPALEVRCPFMDHHLVSLAAHIPARDHLRLGKKSLLRSAFRRDLPSGVFSRPKRGFAVPIGEWFRRSLRSLLTDTLLAADGFGVGRWGRGRISDLLEEHHGSQRDHSARLYALLMLELWHRSRPARTQGAVAGRQRP